MNKGLVTTETSLVKMPDKMNASETKRFAKLINDAESDVRLAKGNFWNSAKRGTREEECNRYEWKIQTMKRYAAYAKEISPTGDISYSHWRNACDAGVQKADRPALLQKAVDKGWTPKQVTDAAIKISGKGVKKDPEPEKDPIKVEMTDEEFKEAKEQIHEEFEAEKEHEVSKLTTTEAFEVFGMGVTDWMSDETFNILYRGLSKSRHPDTGGSDEEMQKLTEAKTIVRKYARTE